MTDTDSIDVTNGLGGFTNEAIIANMGTAEPILGKGFYATEVTQPKLVSYVENRLQLQVILRPVLLTGEVCKASWARVYAFITLPIVMLNKDETEDSLTEEVIRSRVPTAPEMDKFCEFARSFNPDFPPIDHRQGGAWWNNGVKVDTTMVKQVQTERNAAAIMWAEEIKNSPLVVTGLRGVICVGHYKSKKDDTTRATVSYFLNPEYGNTKVLLNPLDSKTFIVE